MATSSDTPEITIQVDNPPVLPLEDAPPENDGIINSDSSVSVNDPKASLIANEESANGVTTLDNEPDEDFTDTEDVGGESYDTTLNLQEQQLEDDEMKELVGRINMFGDKIKKNQFISKVAKTLTIPKKQSANSASANTTGQAAPAKKKILFNIENRFETPEWLKGGQKKFMDKLTAWDSYSALFLVLLGIGTAGIGTCMDLLIYNLQTAHKLLLNLTTIWFLRYLIWIVYTQVLLFVAITLTTKVCPAAAGSGVPELKSILSGGVHIKYFLSFRALVVKVLGLSVALGSGAILGKEGPFVHLSSVIANQLSRLPLFRRIKENERLMHIMLGAACATGVASHFGSPVGGVLFSIEVTSTYYPVRNYWYSFIGTVTGATLFRYLWNTAFRAPGFKPMIPTNYTHKIYFGAVEIAVFIVLGIICGVLSVLFIKWHANAVKYWKLLGTTVGKKFPPIQSPYLYASVIGAITALVTFPGLLGDYMGLSPLGSLADLVQENPMNSTSLKAKQWGSGNQLYLSLFLFVLSRYLITPLSIIMPVPCGLYVPILAIGAGIGRIIGELAQHYLQSSWLYEGNLPGHQNEAYIILAGGYAIAGAAAFAGSVTHTISAAVIIFEITGSIVHGLPVVVATLVAMGTAKRLSSMSIYDSISKIKGLTFLPDLQQEAYAITSEDVMVTQYPVIEAGCELEDIRQLLKKSDEVLFPVVDRNQNTVTVDDQGQPLTQLSDQHWTFRGLVSRSYLQKRIDADGDKLKEFKFKPAPIRFSIGQPLNEIHLLFITMKLTHGFVVKRGDLIGVITRPRLKAQISSADAQMTLIGD